MTTKEKIEVMQAYEDGKQIQIRSLEGGSIPRDVWADVTCEPIWDWWHSCYRIKPEEKKPEYRPYKDTDEMVEDFYKRINSGKASYSKPLIWVRRKDGYSVSLITEFFHCDSDDYVGTPSENVTMKELLEWYTYLDGSPCGKKVE